VGEVNVVDRMHFAGRICHLDPEQVENHPETLDQLNAQQNWQQGKVWPSATDQQGSGGVIDSVQTLALSVRKGGT